MSPSAEHCRLVVPLLRGRDGEETIIFLSKARELRVFNIAWGEDDGDDFAHITSNISPNAADATVDHFYTDEIAFMVDPLSGNRIWEADGTPNVR